MQPPARIRCAFVLAVALASLLQFCLFLNHRDITNAHEGRTAATAREMLQRHQWIIPYCNGQPRLAKPPLMYWAADAVWAITGKIDVWSARLPAALCGAIAVLLIMDLARRTIGPNACAFAGLIWISTWFIVDEYRKAMADPYLAFFTLAAIWAWIAAQQTRDRRTARALILLAYAAAAFGALAKAHLIVVHLALALIPYHLLRKKPPRLLKTHAIGAAFFLIVATAWPAYIFLTVPNAWHIWRVDVVASEATSGEKLAPVWDYIAKLPGATAPWTVVALIGALLPFAGKQRRERQHHPRNHHRRALWPLLWLSATLVVFSCLSMKKAAYILPAMPAATLLAAAGLAAAARLRSSADGFVINAHLVAATLTLGALIYFPQARALSIALLIACGVAYLLLRHRLAGFHLIFLAAALFAASIFVIEDPLMSDYLNHGSDAPFARAIHDRVGADQRLELIGAGLREDVLYYLGGRTVPHVDSIDQLPATYRGFAIVTAEQYDSVRKSGRGKELSTSADRRPDTRMYFFEFDDESRPAPNQSR